jgi:threonine dehydrogenase-like Zn-dependent dehydrogenase
VVEATGSAVEGYQPGDRVVTALGHQAAGLLTTDPAAEDFESYAGRIPDGVSDEQATFVPLADVAVHGLRRAGPQLGDSVAVFGQGVVGQLVTQFARLAGAHPVIAVDLVDERLELARIGGATHTVNAGREDAVEAVVRLTGGDGARVVFMVTRTPKILPDCLRAAAPGGTVALTGSPPGEVTIGLQVELLRKELNLIGTYQAGYPREPFHQFQWTRAGNRTYALELLQRHELRVDHLITHRVPCAEVGRAYEMIARGPEGWLAVILDWTDALPA